jgi:hypothetical protein
LELLEAFEAFLRIPPTATSANGQSFRPDESLIGMDLNSAAEAITDPPLALRHHPAMPKPSASPRDLFQRIHGPWIFRARFGFV